MSDYYKVLEVEPDASAEEIKANYRRLAMKWHPDRNAGSKEAEERFKSIGEAYAVLSDDGKRRQYDAWGASAAAGAQGYEGTAGQPGGPSAEEVFSAIFGSAFASAFGAAFAGSAGSGFRHGFTAEQASGLFMDEMYGLAMELTMQNVAWQDIAAELVRRGCPEDVAKDVARKVEERRKAMIRASAKPYFLRSAVSGAIGLGLFATFAGVGLGILGILGLVMMLSGAYNLIRALWFLGTGRAPKR
jgi:curved DNA-binding protein CbpA